MNGADETPVGRVARVVHPIPGGAEGGHRCGEVVLRIRGGTESYRAFADQPLERGVTVLVLEQHPNRVLFVTPWEDEVGLAPPP